MRNLRTRARVASRSVASLGAALLLITNLAAQNAGEATYVPGATPPDEIAFANRLQETFAAIAERVAPSIVSVNAWERVPDAAVDGPLRETPAAQWVAELETEYPGFRRIASGSGVVVDQEGYILTNRHLLLKPDGELADLVDAETVDGRHTLCRVVGSEPTLNLGILQLEVYSATNPPQFAPIRFGDSAAIKTGHWAIAVGDPAGPPTFFATGVFAGTPSRLCYQEQRSATFLQAALRVHPGALGGALLNLEGEMVGMLSPLDPNQPKGLAQEFAGIEYALPTNIIQGLHETIRRNETHRSPWLGWAVMSVGELRTELGGDAFAALPRPRVGIWIENVFDPSPAVSAGVRRGDFLTKFDGHWIGSPLDFQQRLYMAGIGTEVEVELWRDGEPYVRKLSIEARPPEATTR